MVVSVAVCSMLCEVSNYLIHVMNEEFIFFQMLRILFAIFLTTQVMTEEQHDKKKWMSVINSFVLSFIFLSGLFCLVGDQLAI